ncbi:MAG: hypothetical protein ACI8QF_000119 [Limisphaerales bacterium]
MKRTQGAFRQGGAAFLPHCTRSGHEDAQEPPQAFDGFASHRFSQLFSGRFAATAAGMPPLLAFRQFQRYFCGSKPMRNSNRSGFSFLKAMLFGSDSTQVSEVQCERQPGRVPPRRGGIPAALHAKRARRRPRAATSLRRFRVSQIFTAFLCPPSGPQRQECRSSLPSGNPNDHRRGSQTDSIISPLSFSHAAVSSLNFAGFAAARLFSSRRSSARL